MPPIFDIREDLSDVEFDDGTVCKKLMKIAMSNNEVFLVERSPKNNSNELYLEAMKEIRVESCDEHRILRIRSLFGRGVGKHENLIQVRWTKQKGNIFYVFLEYMDLDNLDSLQLDDRQRLVCFEEYFAGHVAAKLVLALNHLRSRLIAHRDFKPANVLLSTLGDIKVCDFDIGRVLESDGEEMSSLVGTDEYMAPEIFSGKYTLKCEIWSLGIILFKMLFGGLPKTSNPIDEIRPQWSEHSTKDSGSNSDDGKWPEKKECSIEAYDFLNKCLQRDPANRYSADQLTSTKFFLKYNDVPKSEIEKYLKKFTHIRFNCFLTHGNIKNLRQRTMVNNPLERFRI